MMSESSASACIVRQVESPVDPLALVAQWPERYGFFLESADGGGTNARYDVLLFSNGEYLELNKQGKLTGVICDNAARDDFLAQLDVWQQRTAFVETIDDLPFAGGWFVYLGYELVQQVEPKLDLPSPKGELPIALAVRCPAALVHDRQQDAWLIVSEDESCAAQILLDITQSQVEAPHGSQCLSIHSIEEDAPETFLESIERIKQYILDGDVFQVNLSRAWQAHIDADTQDIDIYRSLREANPAPFAGLMHWRNNTVFSSSPERLVSVRKDLVETRPIAGTRPRSREDHLHDTERDALVTHPKERAEHIMLIDLERNDLGRICESGSVEVDELMVLESYAHVHHIVSNVKGRLKPGVTPGEVIRAVFPGGTITGCPKVRCMEIIAELEQVGRGYYTGAMGYLNHNGDMDLNIMIRCIEREDDTLRFRTGAGIVADSIPGNELQETRAKAKGLLKALGSAE